jgi:hypothetical protein
MASAVPTGPRVDFSLGSGALVVDSVAGTVVDAEGAGPLPTAALPTVAAAGRAVAAVVEVAAA